MTRERDELAPPSAHDPYLDIESLIRAIGPQLFGAAFRVLGHADDAREAVGETCLELVRNWPRVSSLPTAERQCSYVFTILANEARQIRRQSHRRHERTGIDSPDSPRDADHLDEHGQAARDHLKLVWKAIDGLPGRQRDAMIWYAAGFEYQEIARMLAIDVSTVRSHVSNARKQLPRAMPGDLEGEQE